MIPYLLIIFGFFALWYYMMSKAGGGSGGGAPGVGRFGKARTRLGSENQKKVTLQGRGRLRGGEGRARGGRELPQEPQGLHRHGRAQYPRACCSSALRARARHCSQGLSPARRACSSSPFPAATSSSLYVGVGASRVRRPLRPGEEGGPGHNLHRRDRTPSDASAAAASAAATTSASRRSTSCSSRWTASPTTRAS